MTPLAVADVLAVLGGEDLPPDRDERVRALLLGQPRAGDEPAAAEWHEFERRVGDALEEKTLLWATAEERTQRPRAEFEAALRELYFNRLLAFARELYPTDVASAGRPAAESLVSSVFSSFFRGQTRERYPDWQSEGDIWNLLIEITRAKFEQRQQAENPEVLPYTSVEPSREFAQALGDTCAELLEQEMQSDEERRVTVLKLQRYTDREVAGQLGTLLEDDVRDIVEGVRAKLRARLFELRKVG